MLDKEYPERGANLKEVNKIFVNNLWTSKSERDTSGTLVCVTK